MKERGPKGVLEPMKEPLWLIFREILHYGGPAWLLTHAGVGAAVTRLQLEEEDGRAERVLMDFHVLRQKCFKNTRKFYGFF